jgi:DNA-binding NarL/FixJ family response regulator
MADKRSLSPREQEVLILLRKGLTPREISRTLRRSINTIALHRKHILKKLAVRTSAAAIQIALERQLVSPPPRVPPDKDERLSS